MELKNSYEAYNTVSIQELLDAEADGRTLLMRILANDVAPNNFLTLIEVLIAGGASPDIRDNKGRTALMYAAQNRWNAWDNISKS